MTTSSTQEVCPSPLALYHLDQGNTFLINNQYQSAVASFTSAAAAVASESDNTNGEKEERQQKKFITFRTYSHRAESYLRLKDYNNAKADIERCHSLLPSSLESVPSVTSFDPNEVAMSYMRLGRAQLELNEYDQALLAFEGAAQVYEKAEVAELVGTEYNRNILKEYLEKCKSITTKATTKVTKPATPSAPVPTPAPAPVKASTVATSIKKPPTCPKYQYYQSDSMMTIAILEPNLNENRIKVEFSLDKLTVIVQKGGKHFTVICGTLFSGVIHSKCKVKYTDEKVLIKLKKKHKHEWHTLFGAGERNGEDGDGDGDGGGENDIGTTVIGSVGDETQEETATSAPSSAAANNSTHRPYASHRDWDAVERDLKRQEESEKPVEGEAFNKFLQDMYRNADEDTRRAMIKSYQTSGGTHLSANWDEVSKTDYEKQRTAPKGQEWKNWEGEKLPMKDDV